ncbi:PREDICTED: E3 ubiquitin-protein ligase AMFR-like [Priapulus caudatus]|uniref:E3 ubiquitin-protein ligase AMFR-like n=1 Tax=Priapulus caudatus TaxID=37621 RepID=A0ABM1DQC8_PRICU|nr:PREDICTED: E3 ubiquitin-protein ligase AMFR-like [Priapulus caudatus]
MPMMFLDRMPLPRMKTYTMLSLMLLASAVFHAHQVTVQVLEEPESVFDSDRKNASNVTDSVEFQPSNTTDSVITFLGVMVDDPWCIWTLINMAYCCLILLGKGIQRLVFGDLRVSEQQHIKDKFWNFVFYKFIFVFGVMNVQYMNEMVLWCAWFSVLGFLHILVQLGKDRFEYLSFSPSTPRWTHIRMLSLLASILLTSLALLTLCTLVGLHAGLNTFAFMAAECVLLTVRTLYVIVRYSIHLWDFNKKGVWENRGSYMYYTELVFELAALSVDFCHHLHMLLWGNIFLSMASLVICMQLRYLFHEMQRRVKKHKNYLRVVHHMEANYPMASYDVIDSNIDDCAICWDKMEAARVLPCNHMFHNSCLRSWLEQDTSCPTCRTSLSDSRSSSSSQAEELTETVPDTPEATTPNRQQRNHFFHFDGSRYMPWLPSFSVEVTHTQLLGAEPQLQQSIQTSQLDSMARQVQSMFPHMPINVIMDDLRVTRSVEITIENILDERLLPAPSAQLSRTGSQPSETLSTQVSTSSSTDDSMIFYAGGDIADGAFLDNDEVLHSSLPDTNSAENVLESFGSRFSKCPTEREVILQKRKESLVQQARKKYMAKRHRQSNSGSECCQQGELQSTGSSSSSNQHMGEGDCESRRRNTLEQRRSAMYLAARQRLESQNGLS